MKLSGKVSAYRQNKAPKYHNAKPPARLLSLRWQVMIACTLLLLAVNLLWASMRDSMHGVYSRDWQLGNPIRDVVDDAPLPAPAHEAHDAVLRRIVAECAKGEDTTIFLEGWGLKAAGQPQVVVEQGVNSGACPLLDIMLGGTERGWGMCTDVALYVMHAGGRIVPNMTRTHEYDSWCGPQTARLHLETMYPLFLSRQPGVLHLMLPNSEHLQQREAALHPHIHAYLCKTRFCERLMRKHASAARLRSAVWFMGHTSADPLAGAGARAPWESAARRWRSVRSFLHVKGKSGLKHTTQLLECWARHPEWPRLTLVGRFTAPSVEAYLDTPNIHFVPEVHDMTDDDVTPHVDGATLRRLQANSDTHICISEREGFGHYLNEARAAGAFIITTDHPPMNELVTNATGVLVRPNATGSHDFMVLGAYADINAYVDADAICGGVEAALKLNEDQAHRLGRINRERYLRDEAALLKRLDDLKAFLLKRRDAIKQASAHAGVKPGKRHSGAVDTPARAHWLPHQAEVWLAHAKWLHEGSSNVAFAPEEHERRGAGGSRGSSSPTPMDGA